MNRRNLLGLFAASFAWLSSKAFGKEKPKEEMVLVGWIISNQTEDGGWCDFLHVRPNKSGQEKATEKDAAEWAASIKGFYFPVYSNCVPKQYSERRSLLRKRS